MQVAVGSTMYLPVQLLMSLLSLLVRGVENAENIKVLFFKENPLPFEIVAHELFLLLDRLGFAVDFLEYDLDKVHLATRQGAHLFQCLLEPSLAARAF